MVTKLATETRSYIVESGAKYKMNRKDLIKTTETTGVGTQATVEQKPELPNTATCTKTPTNSPVKEPFNNEINSRGRIIRPPSG